MKNSTFAAAVGLSVCASLAVALRHSPQNTPAASPVVIVYHDSVSVPGQSRPSGGRYWTLAVRSDGSLMRTDRAADTTQRIDAVRSIEFKDRYVVIDPHTKSISTYKPYLPRIRAGEDCSGSRAGSMLGHPLEYTRSDPPGNAQTRFRVARERWLAVDLNCSILREHMTTTDENGKITEFYREAVSIKPGEPPADFFDVPADYEERGPAEINRELEQSGQKKAFPNEGSAEILQKVYESRSLK